jgi:hypothetical protein
MKRIVWSVLIVLGIVLGVVLYSSARVQFTLPRPEDKAGKEASAFMPREAQGKPTAKGSEELKLTGPVWVNE